jgi:hypothetical protein
MAKAAGARELRRCSYLYGASIMGLELSGLGFVFIVERQKEEAKSISSRRRPPGRNPVLFSVGWMKISAWGGPYFQWQAHNSI